MPLPSSRTARLLRALILLLSAAALLGTHRIGAQPTGTSDGPVPTSTSPCVLQPTIEGPPPPAPDCVVVPNVVGHSAIAAGVELAFKKLDADVSGVAPNQLGRAVVVSQEPGAGVEVLRHTKVRLGLRVPTDTIVPDLAGMDRRRARGALSNVFLGLGAEGRAYSESVAEGRVSAQTPAAGSRVPLDTKVGVTYSLGKAPVVVAPTKVVVPDLARLSREQAGDSLAARHLTLGALTAVDDSTHVGVVVAQRPAAGDTVLPGVAVDLSLGRRPAALPPRSVSVPDLSGDTRPQAQQELAAAGLRLGGVTVRDAGTAGRVVAQRPRAHVEIPRGATVDVVLAASVVAPVVMPSVIGLALAPATEKLRAAHLALGPVDSLAREGAVAPWLVDTQAPRAGQQVRAGTRVRLVMRGARRATVPSVVKLSLDSATTVLNAAGLQLSVGRRVRELRTATVISAQSPAAGSATPADSTVVVALALPIPWLPLALAALVLALAAIATWTLWPVPAVSVRPALGEMELPTLDVADEKESIVADELDFIPSVASNELALVGPDPLILREETIRE